MDLHESGPKASPTEIEAITSVLGVPNMDLPSGLADGKKKRPLLLSTLHAVQDRLGWISAGALGHIAFRLHIPPAEVHGVASFYGLFSLTERPKKVLHLCDDIVCMARGAGPYLAAFSQIFGPEGAEKSGATWHKSPCLGLCERAPAAMLTIAQGEPVCSTFGNATPELAAKVLSIGVEAPLVRTLLQQPRSELQLLRRVGVVDPSSLDDYRTFGGYSALRRALDVGPPAVIREVTDSKLVGRGGAAFPTGRKWAAVAAQVVRPHYVVCNADESEPGTFKDRVLMEEDPFALIEAMTIAGFAAGAERGFIYLRGEYPLAKKRLLFALETARDRGLLGADIMGRGLAFDIELVRGAGAYICGEETALFNSIEGFRGEPRNKPPFPVEVGLFGKPTVVNNVETLVNVLDIVRTGGTKYAAVGSGGSTGTKLYCLSGHVVHPGLYEVPFGTRLDALIAKAGGVPGGRKIRTVLLGGAAGTFLTPDELSVPLTFEDTRKIGATLGSGVVLVLDDSVELLPYLRRMAEFFRDESCGQCVPCRVGTVRIEELFARIEAQKPLGSWSEERVLLKELGQAMRDASICGLGQTATSAVESAVSKLAIIPG